MKRHLMAIVIMANSQTGIYVDSIGNLTIRETGIFQSGVQFPDGVTQTIAYTGQTGDWKVGVSGLTDTITSGETVTFTGVGTSNVFYDESTNILTISGADGGGGTPAGSDTEVQFNDGGAFGADANFTYDKTNTKLSVIGPYSTGFLATGVTEDAEE